MAYLEDYLRTIPLSDSSAIRKAIQENEVHFGLSDISEKEFEKLVNQIAEENNLMTEVPSFSEKIEAAPFNQFYSALSVDLNQLFREQASIEVAGENYDHIYRSNLEEIQRAVENLEQTVLRLEKQNRGEKGLILRSYSFEPENAKQMTETHTTETAYLFADRDGTLLEPAETNRLYHTYSLTLKKKEETNALHKSDGSTSAKLEVLYETPGTVTNTNPEYAPYKAIDGTSDSFWFNICLKSNNGLDKIDTLPKGRE